MSIESGVDAARQNGESPQSLGTAAARNLATTTKTPPQMQGISSRWLLRVLPWVHVAGGTYRVNRRLSYAVGRGRVAFVKTADEVRVIPPSLTELPLLRGFPGTELLGELADRFVQQEYPAGSVLAEQGERIDKIFLLAHGKINKIGAGKYGDAAVTGVLADGDHFGEEGLAEEGVWSFTARTATACTVLSLPRRDFQELLERSEELRLQILDYQVTTGQQTNKHGEKSIELASGHDGEPELPGTFADYELTPREYELSVAQTVLRVHSRVADLFNEPMNQVEQQLRLTIEALRERQEHELVNNPAFGLLHNADYEQRIQTHTGPPTPDDLDDLVTRRRDSRYLLAHPRAIAAFGRECNRRGLYPDTVELMGHRVPAWRGIPLLPCNKIPITDGHISSIIVMRTGEDQQGVVGLHQVGLPDEYEPGLNVRFMGIDEKAIISYLVSAYYSAAVLVPDALGVLENVEIARPRD